MTPSHSPFFAAKRLAWLISATVFTLPCAAAEITLKERINHVADQPRAQYKLAFARSGLSYPPKTITLVAIKDTKRLKVYASDDSKTWKFIQQYPIAGLSGAPGPKLRKGDLQVPEGIYRLTHLNPNSRFWLSVALNYPNAFDRRQAAKDGRKNTGGDIMLHGWWFSTGCVAVGNTAMTQLFVLIHDTGLDHCRIIITPTDFRDPATPAADLPASPAWVDDLYADIKEELDTLGDDGLADDSRLLTYADIAPPPRPKPTTLLGKIVRALANAAETSATETGK